MLSDLRYALRQLAKSPGFTAVVVLSLALGIGANTVVFSSIQAAFFNPLPGVEHSGDLMVIDARDRSGIHVGTSWLEYSDICERQTSFREIAATRMRPLNLGDTGDERVWAELVSENFFRLLRVQPEFGRFFTPAEATKAGSSPVAVISHDFWQVHLRGNPAVLGQTLRLNDVTFTIIGIAPATFKGSLMGLGFDLWVPFTASNLLIPASNELIHRDNRSLMLLADLKQDGTRTQAGAELSAIYQQLAAEQPDTNTGLTPEVLPLWRSPEGAQPIMLTALGTQQALVLLVLLVVCANTATLLLARASVRQKEIGIRLALGAGRIRLIRQLLVESLLLALLGAVGGLLLSLWGVELLHHVPMPGNLPIKMTSHLNIGGCAFSILLAIACGIAFGLVPALQLTRPDISTALKSNGAGAGAPTSHHRLRNLFVAIEVAVALVVLVLAGLFLKSFEHARVADPGFNTQNILLGSFDLGSKGYDKNKARSLVRELLPRLRNTAGVESATISTVVPLDIRGVATIPFEAAGQSKSDRVVSTSFSSLVEPSYFKTMGIPLVTGSGFADLSNRTKPPEAIINQELARRLWPNQSPCGRIIIIEGANYEIVGVAQDSKYATLSEKPKPMIYFSLRDRVSLYLTLQVRTRGDPLALAPEIRRVIRELDPTLTLRDVRTFAQNLDNNLFMLRIPARMLAALGPLALLLAAIGIYSVLAYSVAQRTREIGIRLALGASPRAVVSMIVRQAFVTVAIGGGAGLLIAYLLSRGMQSLWVKMSAGDPVIFFTVPVLLSAVALLACWLPTRRATKVNPIDALRAE